MSVGLASVLWFCTAVGESLLVFVGTSPLCVCVFRVVRALWKTPWCSIIVLRAIDVGSDKNIERVPNIIPPESVGQWFKVLNVAALTIRLKTSPFNYHISWSSANCWLMVFNGCVSTDTLCYCAEKVLISTQSTYSYCAGTLQKWINRGKKENHI